MMYELGVGIFWCLTIQFDSWGHDLIKKNRFTIFWFTICYFLDICELLEDWIAIQMQIDFS